jgi:hypothetical protein
MAESHPHGVCMKFINGVSAKLVYTELQPHWSDKSSPTTIIPHKQNKFVSFFNATTNFFNSSHENWC